jgi:RES domain
MGAGEIMYRIHDTVYKVESFNPSRQRNARFSPIRASAGEVIPTLYAATTPQGALMQTVFHDVPYKPGFKRISIERVKDKLSSSLVFLADLQLIDLGKVGLRRISIHPHEPIDTTEAHYPETRKWAELLYDAYTSAWFDLAESLRMIAHVRSFFSGPESTPRCFVRPVPPFQCLRMVLSMNSPWH